MLELKISSNLLDAARQIGWAKDRVETAAQRSLRAAARIVSQAADARIQAIYDAPIPTSSTGRPLWERSGDLARGRTLSFPSPDTAQITITGAAEVYAARRHELGVSWQPKKPAGGILRRNPFFTEAEDDSKVAAGALFEETFKRELAL